MNNNEHITAFTLLELVLVLFLLGVLASIALTFVENEDSQQRYEKSLQKIDILKKSLVNIVMEGSQPLISGYVTDNGIMPSIPAGNYKLSPLHNIGTLQTYAEKEPYYHYNNGANFIKITDTATNLSRELSLFKGFRNSPSLTSLLDSNNEIRDEWGTNFEVSSVSNNYQVALKSHPPLLNSDRNFTLSATDWSISINQVNAATIKISNNTGAVISNTNGYYVALLIYNNNSTPGNAEWITYRSSLLPNIPTGITNITLTDKITTGSQVVIDSNMLIPVGGHILVLIDNDKIAAVVQGDVVYGSTNHSFKKFTIYPATSLPDLTLEVR